MSRSRTKYSSNVKTKSTWKSNTGLSFSWVNDVDVFVETMVDGTVEKPHDRRLTLSASVRRDDNQSARSRDPRRWPFHTMSYTASSSSEPTGNWEFRDGSSGSRVWTCTGCQTQSTFGFFGSGLTVPAWPQAVDPTDLLHETASSKALNYLDRPKLSLGEPIAELRTLPRDLTPPLGKLDGWTRRYRKRISKFIHLRLKKPLEFAKVAADVWSSYAFHIGPLVRTAEEISEEYASRLSVSESPYQVARGRAEAVGPSAIKSSLQSISGWYVTKEQMRHFDVAVHYGLVFIAGDRVSAANGRLGLVKRDWPVTAWELIPLSFMIDRVVNVKRFLRTAIALTSPDVKISRDSFRVVHRSDVQLLRIQKIAAISTPGIYQPNTSPWWRREVHTFVRDRWSPGLSEIVHTSRGSGLTDSLTKTLDLASLSLNRLT